MMLHEAGHIAVMTPEQREILCNDVSKNPGDEEMVKGMTFLKLLG